MKFAAVILALFFARQGVDTPAPASVNPPATVVLDTPPPLISGDYRIGKDDILDISVLQAPELRTTAIVPANGVISMPWIGDVQVLNATTDSLSKEIGDRLRGRYITDPFVTVAVRQYASQPVSIFGLVKSPGVKQLKGEKTLLDLIVMADGVDATAGTIQILRYSYNADGTRSGIAQKIDINAEDLLQNGNSDLNVPIYPGDVINVLKAGTVRVYGDVRQPAEIVMKSGKTLNVTQAIIFSGGFTPTAKQDDAFILRYTPEGIRQEIPVSAGKMVSGEIPDMNLQPDDILVVPNSSTKSGLRRVGDSAFANALYYAFRVLIF